MANLETLTLKELRTLAKEKEIKGWWNMKKTELIETLNEEPEIVQIAPEEVEPESDVNTLDEEENVSEAKRKNQKRMIEYDGKTQTLTAWAKELGIRHQTLYNRIVMKGWDIEKAFEKPAKKEVSVDAETVETR